MKLRIACPSLGESPAHFLELFLPFPTVLCFADPWGVTRRPQETSVCAKQRGASIAAGPTRRSIVQKKSKSL
jgi:hypothetical protein